MGVHAFMTKLPKKMIMLLKMDEHKANMTSNTLMKKSK